MTYFQYLAYVDEAKKYSDIDSFRGDIGYGPDVPYDGDGWQRVTEVIFAAAHGDVGAIVGDMSARSFAMKYNLPDRSVQNWIAGERSAPEYVLEFLAYAVIGDVPLEDPETAM